MKKKLVLVILVFGLLAGCVSKAPQPAYDPPPASPAGFIVIK